jgi:hypothetical protein
MTQKKRAWGVILVLAALWVASCKSASPSPASSGAPLTPAETTATSIPAVSTDFSSPLATPVSPLPTGTAASGDLVFSIDEPLVKDANTVSGTGPAGMSIVIADLTLMGQALGWGEIGPDGRFSIPVSPSLIANHRIGIMLDTEVQYTADMIARLDALLGDNAITLPRIGQVYDAASVKP